MSTDRLRNRLNIHLRQSQLNINLKSYIFWDFQISKQGTIPKANSTTKPKKSIFAYWTLPQKGQFRTDFLPNSLFFPLGETANRSLFDPSPLSSPRPPRWHQIRRGGAAVGPFRPPAPRRYHNGYITPLHAPLPSGEWVTTGRLDGRREEKGVVVIGLRILLLISFAAASSQKKGKCASRALLVCLSIRAEKRKKAIPPGVGLFRIPPGKQEILRYVLSAPRIFTHHKK